MFRRKQSSTNSKTNRNIRDWQRARSTQRHCSSRNWIKFHPLTGDETDKKCDTKLQTEFDWLSKNIRTRLFNSRLFCRETEDRDDYETSTSRDALTTSRLGYSALIRFRIEKYSSVSSSLSTVSLLFAITRSLYQVFDISKFAPRAGGQVTQARSLPLVTAPVPGPVDRSYFPQKLSYEI